MNLTQTNQQIAARIGSVREVVSRAFTRLQHEGLIAVDGRRLIIPNESALESFAGES
jgi:CRP-like cAMP-binding protein